MLTNIVNNFTDSERHRLSHVLASPIMMAEDGIRGWHVIDDWKHFFFLDDALTNDILKKQPVAS